MKKKLLFVAATFFVMSARAMDPVTGAIAVAGGLWVFEKIWTIANTTVLRIDATPSCQQKDALNETTVREFLWRRQKYLDCKCGVEESGNVTYVGKTKVPAVCKEWADFYAQMCDASTREELFQEQK